MLWEQIHAIAGLSTLMKCHQNSCSWTDGPPIALFRADGVCQEFCVNRFNKQHRIAA